MTGNVGARRRLGLVTAMTAVLALVASAQVVAAESTTAEAVPAMRALRSAVDVPDGKIVPSVAGFGRTAGTFSVSDDGAARYTVPIWVPDGRGIVEPQLSLNYDSRGGNGLLGVGFTLGGLSSIAPCARTIAQDGHTGGVSYDGSDAFCLNGTRLLPVTPPPPPGQPQQREYRTEQESFARVVGYGMTEGVPAYFKVWTKDRKIMTFGQSADSRRQAFRLEEGEEPSTLVRASTQRVTLAWDLNRVEDRNGNAATVEYFRYEGSATELWHVESKPKLIRYAPNREVRFGYGGRSDPIESFGRGVHVKEPQRLTKILVLGGPQDGELELLRQNLIDYDETPGITGRSRIERITTCDGGNKCQQPITFDWSSGSYDFEPIDTPVDDGGQYHAIGGEPEGEEIDNQIVVGDYNGDARDDILYPNTDDWLHDVDQVDDPEEESVQQKWFVRLSTGSGFGPALPAGFAPPVRNCFNPDPPDGRIECTASRGRASTIDVDLDGRLEVLFWTTVSATQSRWRLFAFDGTTFVPHPSGLQGPVETGNDPDPAYFADLDGNGTPDFVTAPEDHPEGSLSEAIDGPWRYRLNTGKAGTQRFGATVDTGQLVPIRPAAQVVDANADGRADLIGPVLVGPGLDPRSAGWGLNAAGAVESRRYALSVNTPDTPQNPVAADVNGDALEDSVYPYTLWRGPAIPPQGQLRAALNSGNGVGPKSGSPTPYREPVYCCGDEPPPPGGEPSQIDYGYDRGVRYVDFNGDGADDVLVFRPGTPIASQPALLGAQLYVWRDGRFEWAPLNREAGDRGPGGFSASRTLDIDGDGTLDILHVENDFDAPDGEPLGHLRILKRLGGVPDRLVGIGDADTRERIEVDHTTLADRSVHLPMLNCSLPQVCLTRGGSVVKEHRTWTFATAGGAAGWDRYTHLYLGAKADTLGRGALGVGAHIVTRAMTGAETTTVFENDVRDGATKSYPFAGLPKRVTATVTDTEAGRGHRTVDDTDYDLRRHPGGGYSVEPKTVTSTHEERPASGGAYTTVRSTTTTNLFDDYGNVAKSTAVTPGGRTVVDDPTFRNDTTAWLLGLPTRASTESCTADDCDTRVSTFDYDGRGQQTLAVAEPNRTDLRLSAVTVYDGVGNVTRRTLTDAAGNAREDRFEFGDADKVHPTATVNALGHRTEREVHAGLGVPLRITDPNGVEVSMRYDGFGRHRGTSRTDGSGETVTHSIDDDDGSQETQTSYAGGGRTVSVVDRLGREFERSTTAFDGSTSVTSTKFDPLGRPRLVSRPQGPNESPRYTTTDYDLLNRPTKVTAPDGVVTTTQYVNRETHSYDGRNTHSYTVTSADGEVALSYQDDPASTNWLRTRFEYGPFGEATLTEAPDGTQQVAEYDPLGRRTRLDDPSTGVTETTYNAFGEPMTERDGNDRTTTFARDDLGRVTSTTSPDGTATNVWDTATHGKGLLARATSTDGVVTVNTYTDTGKPEASTWTVEGTGYQIGYEYDEFGRQAQVTYPAIPGAQGRLKVRYAYNPSGYLRQVRDPAAGGTVYWTAEGRNSAGQLTLERYGNGTSNTWSYSAEVGLVSSVQIAAVGYVQGIGYRYDANRNVTSRQSSLGRVETYGYDTLDRLTSWQLSNTTTTFAYDEMGNLKSETVSGQPERNVGYDHGEEDAPPHALTTRNGARYGYDDAGRQVSGAGRTVTYNQTGLPRSLTWGQGQRTEFRYDAAGARVLKRDAGAGVVTVAGLFERRDAPGTKTLNLHNIVADGRVVAQVTRTQATPTGPTDEPTVDWIHTDVQGSTTVVTNGAGRQADAEGWLRDIFYDPFGRRVEADGTPLGTQRRGGPRQGFAANEHDDEFGLVNMTGRIYDPEQRRFLTPDPLVPNPLNSQDHNRYAYVGNNPASSVDPTGHAPEDNRASASYVELEGTDRGLYDMGAMTRGATVSGIAASNRLDHLNDTLLDAVARYVGGGGPEQLNATPAESARSDGDSPDRSPDDGAENVKTGLEVADTVLDLVGTAEELPGPVGYAVDAVGTVVDLISGTLDVLPDAPESLSGILRYDAKVVVRDTWKLFRWTGSVAEAIVAAKTVYNVLTGYRLLTAGRAAALSMPVIAFMARVSVVVGVLAGAFRVGTWLRNLSGLSDADLAAGARYLADRTAQGQLAQAEAVRARGEFVGDAVVTGAGAVVQGVEAAVESVKNTAEETKRNVLEPLYDPYILKFRF